MDEAGRIGAAELAMRLVALSGISAYVVVLTDAAHATEIAVELGAELRALDDSIDVVTATPTSAARLIHEPPAPSVVTAIIAISFGADDWRLLDMRRSDIARPGASVFITTPQSFDELMRTAPNLASWLGGFVFGYDARADVLNQEAVEARLVALRAWAGRSDDDVLRRAERDDLPKDPEYGEWLVLLGRGDLIRD